MKILIAILVAFSGSIAVAEGLSEYVVQVRPNLVSASVSASATSVLAKLEGKKFQRLGAVVTKLSDKQVVELRAKGLRVVPNARYQVLGFRTVGTRSSETTQEIPWGISEINAPKANQLTDGAGEGVTVCVVDTGVDATHPDLEGQVVGGVAIEPSTTPGGPDWADDHGHGTHVSGTIAAVGKGVVGVAPKAKIFAVKVLSAEGYGSTAGVAEGIRACIGQAQVINLSLGGGPGNVVLQEALMAASDAGLQIACAAGNDSGSVNYPAKYIQCKAITALTKDKKIASFSSRGPEVDFIAPGVDVKSTTLEGAYETWSGTSMATPHVAGVMAIMLSRKKTSLRGVKLKGLKPPQQGQGRIDALKTAG